MKTERCTRVCASSGLLFADAAKRVATLFAPSRRLRKISDNCVVSPYQSTKEESCCREPRAESRRSRSRSRRLTWLLILGFSGLCLAAANLAHAYLTPSDSFYGVYEWVAETATANATDADNWQAPADAAPLPNDGAHLLFGNKATIPEGHADWWTGEWIPGVGTVVGLGDAPLPARYASLWFGFGEREDALSYTLTGPGITVGHGTAEIDRLIVAQGWGPRTFDLDVHIDEVLGLAFRIHNEGPSDLDKLVFARTLTSDSGRLIVSGPGYTTINALHGSGTLIKEGEGELRVDAAHYTGEVVIRDGALIGAISDDSVLTLEGGVYGLPDATGIFERDLGPWTGQVRWLAGKSGGFTVLDGAKLNITLNGWGTLTWGEPDFVSIGSELLFGSAEASGSLYWHNALDLGNPANSTARTIRLNRKYDRYAYGPTLADFSLYLSEELIAEAGQKLRFIGSGTVVVSERNYDFRGDLEIAGVELQFEGDGHFFEAPHLTISEGGTLAISIGEDELFSPLFYDAAITLSSGTLLWDDPHPQGVTRSLGDIILAGGANRIERTSTANDLRANSLVRTDERSTLLVALFDYAFPSTSLLDFDDVSALESTEIGGIHPWLVVTTIGSGNSPYVSDWGIFEGDYFGSYLTPHVNYYTGSEGNWSVDDNINVSGSGTVHLSGDRMINSLRLDSSALELGGHTLTIASGGILVNKSNASGIYDGSTFGAVTTAGGRPLYIHTHSDLDFTAQITGGIDLVKTGAGQLSLSPANYWGRGHPHQLGSLYIHQGELVINGQESIETGGPIYVGDGGSYAALVLEDRGPGGPPIFSGNSDIRLRGGHDGSKAAELHLAGNHDLRLNALSISGNSVLEFQVLLFEATISKIYSEVFTIDPTGRLLVRGWIQKEAWIGDDGSFADSFTHILVRKTSPGLDDYLRQIWFEDYGPATKIDWAEDNSYWEIVPGYRGWANPFPEPSTYGAILAAAGIGLVLWRKRSARAATCRRRE